ncbi:MAG: P-loop NTPase fold protein [Bacteroidota bacterium]
MNQTTISDRITQYLAIETSYSIVLNGGYGIGKTHYLKHILFPKIKEEAAYIPILISLFGIDSIKDLQKSIYVELYPILKKKGVKIATGITNNLFKFFSGIELDEMLSNQNHSGRDFIDFDRLFLCIDDVDRKGKNLDTLELYGYINNLVENYGTKVLLVSNEEIIKQNYEYDAQNKYSEIKEKVIGVTLNFSPNFTEVFTGILEKKYRQHHSAYYVVLEENKDQIQQRIAKNEDNFRNLLFFLESFKYIFQSIDAFVQSDEQLRQQKALLYSYLIRFSLPLAIEYKMGRATAESIAAIKECYSPLTLLKLKMNSLEETSLNQRFRKKYLNDTDDFFYESLFNYFMGIKSFDLEQFKEEIHKKFLPKENISFDRYSSRKDVLLDQLSFEKSLTLSDEEYHTLTNELLDLIDRIAFRISEYPKLFLYVVRYENMLNLDIQHTKERFKKAIQKNLNYQNRYAGFNESSSLPRNPYNEYLTDIEEIHQFCLDTNALLFQEKWKIETDNYFKAFSTSFDEFQQLRFYKENSIDYMWFFNQYEFEDLWKIISGYSDTEILAFAIFLLERYPKNSGLEEELKFLEKLYKKCTQVIKNKELKRSNYKVFIVLKSKAFKSIQRIKN